MYVLCAVTFIFVCSFFPLFDVKALESQLFKELDNGRLFRLVAKLGMINERPEFGQDAAWAETGDRYLLKLLRDYIFHQVSADGAPVIGMGHVVDSLNRLDAGTADKVPLVSRDHKVCLFLLCCVVSFSLAKTKTVLLCSFKDLKKAVDDCFGELVKKSGEKSTSK
jgi:PAB-dependent poly(A)-specific ribonuclease subunit 3